MQKMRVQLQIVIGIFLLISALTGGKQVESLTSKLPSISLVSTRVAKAATLLPQAAELINASPIIHCSACHNSMDAASQNTAAGEIVQFIRLRTHVEPILQCAFCHSSSTLKAYTGLLNIE